MNPSPERKGAALAGAAASENNYLTLTNNSEIPAPNQASYAVLAPRLLVLGYEPIPTRPNAKAPIPNAWTAPDADTFTAWQREHPNAGVGLLTRHTPALDIDILVPAAADAVETLARAWFGDSPLRRVGLPPKRLLVYRTATPFPKRHVDLLGPDDPEDAKGQRVEVLCDGQQFIASGIHPDTGRPYVWTGDTPLDHAAADLPEMFEDLVLGFLNAAADLLISEFGYRRKAPKKTDAVPPPPLPPGDLGKVTDALRFLALASDEYDSWVRNGHALKSGFGDAALPVFHWWSSLSKKYDREETDRKWASLKPSSITPASIYYDARLAGWKPPLDCSGFTDSVATPPVSGLSDTGAVATLSHKTPYISARIFVGNRHTVDDVPTLHFHGGSWRQWNGSHYPAVDEGSIRAMLYPFLERAFDPTKNRVSDVLDALKAATNISAATPMPSWLRQDASFPPASEVLPCTNGLLHLPTQALYPHNPAFFNANALEFAYNANAPLPINWLRFLGDLWQNDPEAIASLQDLFGLYLTNETRHQKIALIVGPKRSGKGTLARVLRALIGKDNVCSPTLASLSSNFGLAPLIDKPLAIISDARLSARADQSVIAERLLSISGEDSCTIDRKFLPAWNGRLPTRFLVMTNELPRITDSSGALASRFIILTMSKSFYGREDHGLTSKLLEEMPGILNWAIAGWQRLQARGYLMQPRSSADTVQELEDLSSPISAFLRDRCTVAPGAAVPRDAIYTAWLDWCRQQGRDHPGNAVTFGRDLRAAVAGLSDTKCQGIRHYAGVRLNA